MFTSTVQSRFLCGFLLMFLLTFCSILGHKVFKTLSEILISLYIKDFVLSLVAAHVLVHEHEYIKGLHTNDVEMRNCESGGGGGVGGGRT
jgi:hypothetical protein